jgi:transposase-like protein
MKKEPSESPRNSKNATRRRRKYDEEFIQLALAMVRNGQSPRPGAEALGVSENLIRRWKRTSRALPKATEDEIERLRRIGCEQMINAD